MTSPRRPSGEAAAAKENNMDADNVHESVDAQALCKPLAVFSASLHCPYLLTWNILTSALPSPPPTNHYCERGILRR